MINKVITSITIPLLFYFGFLLITNPSSTQLIGSCYQHSCENNILCTYKVLSSNDKEFYLEFKKETQNNKVLEFYRFSQSKELFNSKIKNGIFNIDCGLVIKGN